MKSRKQIKLQFNSHYEDGVLYHGWNEGFFSCLSTCLWNVVYLYSEHKIQPERIDFSFAFNHFKTDEQKMNNTNTYPMLFKAASVFEEPAKNVLLEHHTLYRQNEIEKLGPFVAKYFLPNDSIIKIQEKIIDKYKIDTEKTLVVCMRGTDKEKEIKNTSPEKYFDLCAKLLKLDPALRVWVQTDQRQYQEYFLERLGQRAFAVNELPVTGGVEVLHLDSNQKFDHFVFGQNLLAVINLISRCDTVITHTGNVGYWQALYRGNVNNFFQDTTHFYRLKNKNNSARFNALTLKYRLRDFLYQWLIMERIRPRYR